MRKARIAGLSHALRAVDEELLCREFGRKRKVVGQLLDELQDVVFFQRESAESRESPRDAVVATADVVDVREPVVDSPVADAGDLVVALLCPTGFLKEWPGFIAQLNKV